MSEKKPSDDKKIFPEDMEFEEAINRLAKVNPQDLSSTPPEKTDGRARPFVKWAGGKGKLLDVLISKIPSKFKTYYEPFLGGGALFWRLAPRKAVLSDVNIDLVITYKVIQETPMELIESLRNHNEKNTKEYFYAVRDNEKNTKDPVEVAARFIYLNKTCYNGLYRVNKKGKFNVPFSRSAKNPLILDEGTILACHEALRGVDIRYSDFVSCEPVGEDFVYLDPPYHETYNGYSINGFSLDNHKKLSEYCKNLNKRGVFFMLSNSDTPQMKNFYKEFSCEIVKAPRTISCKGSQRKATTELLVRNYQ